MHYYSLTVFVPVTHGAAVRAALAASGAGSIGTYDSCSWTSTPGVGRFRPLAGARPHIGTIGLVEDVLEERIETEVAAPRLPAVLAAVRGAHPYETPAIHVVALHALGEGAPEASSKLAALEARVAALEAALPAGGGGASAPAPSLEARLQRLELAARIGAVASPGRGAEAAAAAASASGATEGRLAAAEELLQQLAGSLHAHTEALEDHSELLATLAGAGGAPPRSE
jgi:hypothetical protein